MPLTCPSCGQENPEAGAFCLTCGSSLLGQAAQLQTRKTITILYSDVVGSTALAERLDTEILTVVMRQYFDLMRRVIRRHGGTVEKFIGDAVVAVFGYPTVREDDALRAVRAAEEMQSELQDLNTELVREFGVALETRTGVNTGEVLVSALAPGSNFAAGDVMNTGARLQQLAAPGEVLLGEVTWLLVRDAVEAEGLGPTRVKGKADPVSSWRLVKVLPGRGGVRRQLDSPLVGRRIDLGLLIGSFQKAVQEPGVQLVTIVGEPGVGKTRLVHELRRFVEAEPDHSVRWREGRCLSYGEGITFWALGEILKAEAGILDTDPSEVAAEKIDAAVLATYPEAVWLRQRLRPLVGVQAPQAGREENFAAWRGFLELLAEAMPSVFVFEDMQWADEALLAFLEHLANHAQGVPMLVAATARPELFERAPAWAVGVRNWQRINLSPLSEADTTSLVSNLLEKAVVPANVQAIVSRAGGNPLYAEEFVRLLEDSGNPVGKDPTLAISLQPELGLPVGVQGLIAARLDTLAPDRRLMLQDAAVVGRVFWSGAVASMGERGDTEVQVALHELSRRELVRPARRSSMQGQAEYAFSHDLIREVCYSQIPRSARTTRHRRAAEWIEQVAGDRIDDRAEIVASHYVLALELAVTARDRDEELRRKAVHYLTLSGDASMRMDVEGAERHYSQALELASEDLQERPRILARYAEALAQRSRFPEAARAYQEAIDGLEAAGDPRAMAAAMVRQSFVLRRLGEEGFQRVMTQAVTTLEGMGPSIELIRALTMDAAMSAPLGELDQAIRSANRALTLARELGVPVPASAIGFRGAARAALGDAGGLEDMFQALDFAKAEGLGQEVAILYNDLSEFLGHLKGPRARVKHAREGVAFARRRGIEDLALWLSENLFEALVDVGSYDEAEALGADLIARLRQAEDVYLLVFATGAQTRLRTRRGREIDQAALEDWLTRALRIAPADVLPQLVASGSAAKLLLGNAAGALSLLEELATHPEPPAMPAYEANLPDLVRTALAAGDIPLAHRLARALKSKHGLHEPVRLSAQALLAEAGGELLDAAGMFAAAAERWATLDMPWEQAQALLGAGRCLLSAGYRDDADAPLRQAKKVFVALGARLALAETDELLERLTGRG